jgi:leucyl/phenylalanyl-tRNA--protein transferase
MDYLNRIKESQIKFPDVEQADEDGLLAWGGNMEPETLVEAYSHGIFPWTASPVTWWSPDAINRVNPLRFDNSRQILEYEAIFQTCYTALPVYLYQISTQ